MSSPATWLKQRVLAIPREEVRFSRRGFRAGDPRAQARLERIGDAVLDGYHAALASASLADLERAIAALDPELAGFAYEGAAMACALQDRLFAWRGGRWSALLAGPGSAHPYMVHVGAGLALARLRRRPTLPSPAFDPLLGWLVADGYGFHEGFFHWDAQTGGASARGKLRGYARRAFDQGLGRSLWFVFGAQPRDIGAAIDACAEERRGDLWSGVGLACAYAGGIDRAAIEALATLGLGHRADVAQGAAFGAQARRRAGNPAEHTDLACKILCGAPAEAAARATEDALAGLPADVDGTDEPAYEIWRRRLQAKLGRMRVPA